MHTSQSINTKRFKRGFSMAEMLIVVAVIGILVTIGVYSYKDLRSQTQAVVARNTLETLNQAVHRFNEANYEIYYTGTPGITEMQILRTLQYRNSANPATGSPYIRSDWNPAVSSSTAKYRLVWTGTLYKLVSPGSSGNGLVVSFDGSDLGTPFVFPPNFSLAGK
jgi:prepilin-type N-terminal cleavage/methylation domain-containing protein